jgi:hypothetical protein
MSKQKTYTIEQIKEYLEGWFFIARENDDYNVALHNAIVNLDNPEDGIEAVIERKAEI